MRDLKRAFNAGTHIACLKADRSVVEAMSGTVHVLDRADLLDFSSVLGVIRFESVHGLIEAILATLSQSRPYGWVRQLYGSADIDFYYRRSLLYELAPLIGLANLLSKPPLNRYESINLHSDWPVNALFPVFLSLWQDHGQRKRLEVHLPGPLSCALDRLRLTDQRCISSKVKDHFRTFYYFAATWYLVLRQVRPFVKPLPQARLLLRTYPSDWGVDLGGKDGSSDRVGERKRMQNVDFMIDCKEIKNEDVAVWVEQGVSADRQQALRRRGYRLVRAEDVTFGIVFFAKQALPLLLSYSRLLPSLSAEGWWKLHLTVLTYYYLLWEEACRRIKPAVFLSYNDISARSVARNLVLHRSRCLTVCYQFSCNQAIGEDGSYALNQVYPYQVVGAFATWAPVYTKQFQSHPGAIHAFGEVGCIFSELVRLVTEDPVLVRYYTNQLNTDLARPVDHYKRRVAVFDTSISTMLSAHDLMSFYGGIVRVAQRMPEALFLCKPKNAIEGLFDAAGEDGKSIQSLIAKTPNVVFVPLYFDEAALVSLTDLTIAACFTSLAVQTLGAGKRAVFFDPTNRLPHAFWRRIPGLVCVTDEEFYERLYYLLYDCDDATYLTYLRRYCMHIEGHFDGRGIARLRQRLLEMMSSREL